MVLLDIVYLSMNRNKSYGNVIPKLMEDIMRKIGLLTRNKLPYRKYLILCKLKKRVSHKLGEASPIT